MHDLDRVIRAYPVLSAAKQIDLLRRRIRVTRVREQQRIADLIVLSNLRLVYKLANAFARRSTRRSLEDSFQHGVCGLIVAIPRFDPFRGVCFSTYATWWIKQAIRRGGNMDAVDTIANVPHGVTNALCRYWKCVESGTSHEDALQLASSSDGSRSCLASALRLFQDVYSLSVDNEQSSSGDPVSVIDIADHREHTDAAEIQDSIRHVDYLLDLLEPRERDVLCYRFGVRGFEQQTLSQTGRKFDISKERVRQIETRALSKLAAAVCSA